MLFWTNRSSCHVIIIFISNHNDRFSCRSDCVFRCQMCSPMSLCVLLWLCVCVVVVCVCVCVCVCVLLLLLFFGPLPNHPYYLTRRGTPM